MVPPSAARLWKLLQWRERLARVARAIWSLLAWQAGRGKVLWQGSNRGLGRAGSTEPVCLGLSDESLPLCVQGGHRGGGCSWFPAGACGGLWLQLSAVRAEPCPSSLCSKQGDVTPLACWAASPLGSWLHSWGLQWRGRVAAASVLARCSPRPLKPCMAVVFP